MTPLLLTRLQSLRRRPDAGATAVEYALMVGFIAIVIVAAITLLGTNLSGIFDRASTSI